MNTENKRSLKELQQLQRLPLDIKIRKTELRIKEWYEYWNGDIYVSFSGGIDSTVLLHITRSIYPDVEAVFADTGLEYPEIRNFVKTFDNVTWIKPEMSFKQVVLDKGYPIISKEVSQKLEEARKGYSYRIAALNGTATDKKGRKSRYNIPQYKFLLNAPFKISSSCCDIMKKKPFKKFERKTGKRPMTGQMSSESQLRKTFWILNGCNAFNTKRPISNPMSFWTRNDVLRYLKTFEIPYCELYGEIIEAEAIDKQIHILGCEDVIKYRTTGVDRTGCIFCGMGVHMEKYPNRFQRLKKSHPKLWEYCMKPIEDGGLGLKDVLNYISVDYQ